VFDAGMGIVVGVATFDVRSSAGVLISRASIFGIDATRDFSFPVDITQIGIASNTGFAIANVNPTNAVTFNLQLTSENGSISPTVTGADMQTIMLPARHQIAKFVTDIWPQLAAGFKGTLVVWPSPGQPISLVLTALSIQDGLLSAIPVITGPLNGCPGCWDY
jgi:hypothetical protein